jgi:hypothetical protein
MKYYATHLTASEIAILEEATTAALEQLGRSPVSDPHAFADVAIGEDLMDALLDCIYDSTEQSGPDEQHATLTLTADLREVARALLTAASAGFSDRSASAQEDGDLAMAALLLAQATLAREVDLRLAVCALEHEAE